MPTTSSPIDITPTSSSSSASQGHHRQLQLSRPRYSDFRHDEGHHLRLQHEMGCGDGVYQQACINTGVRGAEHGYQALHIAHFGSGASGDLAVDVKDCTQQRCFECLTACGTFSLVQLFLSSGWVSLCWFWARPLLHVLFSATITTFLKPNNALP